MNVLKIVIVSLFVFKLFAFDLYIPEKYHLKINIKNITIKKYKNIDKINFNNSLALISYNYIPLIFKKNLTIITPLGELKEYILTHKKSLNEIKTIVNPDFASKILLNKINAHYKIVNGDLNSFLKNKIRADAFVANKNIDKGNIYDFPLKLYGIDFNKYFLVSNKKFIKKHYEFIKKLNKIFEKNLDFREDLIYKTLLISSYYLNKPLNFNKILFENYKLVYEKKEESLIVDVTSKWPPFHMLENGHLYGIGIDFWKLIAKKAKLKYKFHLVNSWSDVLKNIKTKKADLTIDTSDTSDREKYALFSKPYVSFPLAIICRNGENFNSINDIKSIALGKNYTAEKLMKKHYPNLNYIETNTTFDALKLVKEKKAQCAVDILPVILWTINKNHFMNLQLAFKTPFDFNVQIMVKKNSPGLVAKINRAIDEITPHEKNQILKKYLNTVIIQKSSVNKYILLGILSVIIIIILIIVFIGGKKFKKIKKEAFYDELTGILNRRGLLDKIKNIKNGSVLFFDIDHFKKINDTYGHEFGDYVLKEIGEILKNTFRNSDIVGRWGGEEFIVILSDTDYENALKLAERLRKIIENYYFKGIKVTISVGVSEYKGHLAESLKKADEALYEAKNSGRNNIKGKK